MKSLLNNKWLILSIMWFGAGVYALIFREASGNPIPPFPHFDKVAHCLLFFCQIWLLARTWIEAKKRVPEIALLIFALVLAIGSEWAQATFTLTRQADVWDGVADMVGALLALGLARYWQKRFVK